MRYFKVYTSDNIPECYVKTEEDITPEGLCERIGCPNYVAVPITKQCYEEFIDSKYNNWDLKETY